MDMMMLLVLALAGGGDEPVDLVKVISTDAYFKARNVPINVDNMIYLAAKDPSDGQAQIKQLLALRVLADRADEVKKSKSAADILKTLEQIAKGEAAKDTQGFAQEYAATALARIKGTPVKLKKVQPGKLAQDALAWFPASVTIAAALDLRPTGSAGKPAPNFDVFWKFIPAREQGEIFNVIEMLGNVRIERLAFGYAADDKNTRNSEIYFRFSGKADAKRLAEGFKTLGRANFQIEESKDPKGVPIRVLLDRNRPPAMALIGDTEFLMVGVEAHDGNHRDILDRVLAVRAGKHPSVFKGQMKDALAKLSPKASGFCVGDVPDQVRRELSRRPFGAVPKSIRAELFDTKEGMDLRLLGAMENAEAAKTFNEAVARLKQEGLDNLKNIPPDVPLPPGAVNAFRKTLESIQLTVKDAAIDGRMLVPPDAVLALPSALMPRRVRDFDK